jgi:hypothetical protein
MNILAQYGVGTGKGSGQFLGETSVRNVSGNVSDDEIRRIIAGQIAAGGIPKPDRNQLVIAFLDETIAVADAGVTMCEPNGDTAFGYHSFFALTDGSPCYYAVIPSLDDNCISNTCPVPNECSLQIAQTQEQRRTQVVSHEFGVDPVFETTG